MLSEARQKNMEKLNRAKKCSIFGPQNLGSRGPPPGPPGSPPEKWSEWLLKETNLKTLMHIVADS